MTEVPTIKALNCNKSLAFMEVQRYHGGKRNIIIEFGDVYEN